MLIDKESEAYISKQVAVCVYSRYPPTESAMFKKKPTVCLYDTTRLPSDRVLTRSQIKPLAPLRSSDRRRTADQIISDYGLDTATPDTASAEDKAAATAARTSLRNSLFPDNVQSARFTTTHGPDLKKVSGTVYVGAQPGEDTRILWFKIEEVMFPSGWYCHARGRSKD